MARIFIISAPSGGGKTSIVNGVLERLDKLHLSISYTTRPIRPNEEDGKDYHFVTPAEFEQMRAKNKFLEHAQVFGNYYGTSRQVVEDVLQQGFDIILEIDWQGAKQIKDNFPDAVLVFLLPPSMKILAERLHKRASDSKEVIKKRLQEAELEISNYGLFDHLLVNDDFDATLDNLIQLVNSIRAGKELQETKRDNQEEKLAGLIADLVKDLPR